MRVKSLPRTLTEPSVTLSFVLLTVLAESLSGCKHPMPQPKPQPVAVARPVVDAAKLTDQQLVAANQRDGLGIGLQIPGESVLGTKSPLPLHILLEDFSARTGIAAGLCGGFYLILEDAATHELTSSQLTLNLRCFDADPYPDSIALEKNKLKTVEANTLTASHVEFTPGKYLVSVEWHAYPAGPGTIDERTAYTTLQSNAVPITFKP